MRKCEVGIHEVVPACEIKVRLRSRLRPAFYPFMFELELELIHTQMAQKPVLREEVHARALRASQNLKRP